MTEQVDPIGDIDFEKVEDTKNSDLLNRKLFDICKSMRYKVDYSKYKNFIFGFIFYKYLSEKIEHLANEILKEHRVTYMQMVAFDQQEEHRLLDIVRPKIVAEIGIFLTPCQLFNFVIDTCRGEPVGGVELIRAIKYIFNIINDNTLGNKGESGSHGILHGLDFSNFGRSEEEQNEFVELIMNNLSSIDFSLKDTDKDIMGDGYEFLISKFSSLSNSFGGVFYTPQTVSKLLTRIVTLGRDSLDSIYDPTCGSGSLLLGVTKEVKNFGTLYGQELFEDTYNLARMNMILHGVHHKNFDIRNGDTLNNPLHEDIKMDAIVANPPFSQKWDREKFIGTDKRFEQFDDIAPKTRADFSFLQHMIYHLKDDGVLACVMPHGVLFRAAAEHKIRRQLLEELNYIDAIIGLPKNMFTNTGISICIIVIKKNRQKGDPVLFIDASAHFKVYDTHNILLPKHINRIMATYDRRTEKDKYSRLISLEEIKENDYNLNLTRYINTYEDEAPIDLNVVANDIKAVDRQMKETDKKINSFCDELGIISPFK